VRVPPISPIEPVPARRSFHSAIKYNNGFVIFGGRTLTKPGTSDGNYDHFPNIDPLDTAAPTTPAPTVQTNSTSRQELCLNDVWYYDVGSWATKTIPSPPHLFISNPTIYLSIYLSSSYGVLVNRKWTRLSNGTSSQQSSSSQLVPLPRKHHSSVLYLNKFVLVYGGYDCANSNILDDLWVFNLDSKQWLQWPIDKSQTDVPGPRWGHVAAIIESAEAMIIVGGSDYTASGLIDAYALHLGLLRWSRLEAPIERPSKGLDLVPVNRRFHGGTLINDSRLVIFGGITIPNDAPGRYGCYARDVWQFDFCTQSSRSFSFLCLVCPSPSLRSTKSFHTCESLSIIHGWSL